MLEQVVWEHITKSALGSKTKISLYIRYGQSQTHVTYIENNVIAFKISIVLM